MIDGLIATLKKKKKKKESVKKQYKTINICGNYLSHINFPVEYNHLILVCFSLPS